MLLNIYLKLESFNNQKWLRSYEVKLFPITQEELDATEKCR